VGVRGIWKRAVRAWLETAIPPVFGKEMNDAARADTSNTGTGFFFNRFSE
jgi:hypothetical protein